MRKLFAPASLDDLIMLLRAWRLWLLGALIGGLAGAGLYLVLPPDFRTQATVVVSFNMEKAWPDKPDNELFYYLERESRKIEETAWSDAVLANVSKKTGYTVSQLRAGRLELSQPQDGGWHFYGIDPSANKAESLASAWAQAFTEQVQAGILNAVELDAVHTALEKAPADKELLEKVKDLEIHSLAITPEIQISLSQSSGLPSSRVSSQGMYTLAGAGIFLALISLLILFFAPLRTGKNK